jgi:hypothetical protein
MDNRVNYIRAIAIVALMFFLVSILIPSCFSHNYRFKSIRYIRQYPVTYIPGKDGLEPYYLKDTIAILYFDKYVLYKLYPTIQFETGEHIAGTEPLFLHRTQSSTGRFYSSMKDSSKGVEMRVDSFNLSKLGRGHDFDNPQDSIWRLVSNYSTGDGRTKHEKYAVANKTDEMLFDSIFYSYSSSFKDLDFSFSRKLEKEKGMKLFKVVLLYDKGFSSSKNMVLPERSFQFEIQNYNPPNSKQLIDFVKKHENDL